jgi:hypothetical protein
MARIVSGAFVGLNGIDLSCYLKNIKISGNADILDATVLCASSRYFAKGLVERTVTADGFFKYSSDDPGPVVVQEDIQTLFDTALTNVASDYLMLVAPDGTTTGLSAIMLNTKTVKYDIDEVVGNLITTALEAKETATATSDDTFDSAGATPSYDAGAGATGWFLQIQSCAGDAELKIVLQHSTNNSTWVDLYDIFNEVGIISYDSAYEFKNTTDSVSRYIRLNITDQSGGSSNRLVAAIKSGYTG